MTTIDRTQVDALARRFATNLEEEIGAENFAEVRRRNAARAPGDTSCASHDFCDANMVMFDAFDEVVGREPNICDGESLQEQDLGLINEAWSLAKSTYMGAR